MEGMWSLIEPLGIEERCGLERKTKGTEDIITWDDMDLMHQSWPLGAAKSHFESCKMLCANYYRSH